MEKNDDRTFEQIKADIYEAASLGYDQTKAQEWANNEVRKAYAKYIETHLPPLDKSTKDVEKSNNC